MTRYLGIDPGLSGALAIVETINGVPVLIDAIDMPSTGTGAKARVDIIAAAEWIAKARAIDGLCRARTSVPRARRLERILLRPRRRRHRGGGRAVLDPADPGRGFAAGSAGSISPAKTKKRPGRRRCSCFRRSTHCSRGRNDHGRAEAALIVVASLERAP